jgi:hypothetical protein
MKKPLARSTLFTLTFARKAACASVLAIGVAIAATSVARASLVLVGDVGGSIVPVATVAEAFVDLGGAGFGNAPRMLTLQTNTVETGNVTPVDVANGDAVSGANKSTTPTLGTLGWTSGSQVGIGFLSDQSGQTGITMQSLTLTIFNGTTAVGSFSLASSLAPLTFTADDIKIEQGNANGVFDFGLNLTEQGQFNAILALSGSSGFLAGLSSQLGCPAGAPAGCLVSNDGPDTFLGFAQSAVVVPLPAAFWFMLTGLVGLIGFGSKWAIPTA